MNKILCILMAVIALSAVIECTAGFEDGTNKNNLCSIVPCVNEQHLNRQKRANGRAVEILGGVDRLITNILNANWKGIERVKAQSRKKTIVVGPGKHNKNKVIINSRRH